MKHVDVVIVGAGPVGLLLAIELSLTGTSCLLLEARSAPEEVQKALSIGPLGAEALMRRGLGPALDRLEARTIAMMRPAKGEGVAENQERRPGAWTRPGTGSPRFSGHFAGILLMAQGIDKDRPTRLIDQRFLQQMLLADIERRNIAFWRGSCVTGFQDRDGEVVLELSHDGAAAVEAGCERVSCRFAVGCDGGKSTMRKQGGFAFAGTPPGISFYQVFATFENAGEVPPPGWQTHTGGIMAYGPLPGRLFLVDFSGPPPKGQHEPDRHQVESAIARICGRPVALGTYRGGRCWTDHTRLVDRYRNGHVLLAGDAAHIHAPFGGQGLGLGLCDAANLGWKLAAVLSGRAPDALLDTYTAERRPVAEGVLDNTRAQLALMRPDAQSRALRAMMADMLGATEAGAWINDRVKGFAIRYDPGHPVAAEDTQTGALIADCTLADGRSLYTLMHNGAGVLLHPANGPAPGMAIPEGVVLAGWDRDRLALIRPDGCLIWQGSPEDSAECAIALTRWFGPPLPVC